MKRRRATAFLAAAVGGICAGLQATPGFATEEPAKAPKHVCKGRNECKALGNCKHGCSGHGCAGKNDCKAKGGCASEAASHKCAGKNDCKGVGGCAAGDQGCAGKNSCKHNGGCEVPLRIDHTRQREKKP